MQARLYHLSHNTEQRKKAAYSRYQAKLVPLVLRSWLSQNRLGTHCVHRHLQGFTTAHSPPQNESITFAVAFCSLLHALCRGSGVQDVTDWHLRRCRKTCETQLRWPPSYYHLEAVDLEFLFIFCNVVMRITTSCAVCGVHLQWKYWGLHSTSRFMLWTLSSWCQRRTGRKTGDHVAGTQHGSESTGGSSVTNTRAKKPWKSKGSDEITLTTSMKLECFAIRSEFVLQSSGVSLYPIYIYFEAINPQFWSLPICKGGEGLTASLVLLPSDTWEGKFTARGKEELLQVLTPKQDCQTGKFN